MATLLISYVVNLHGENMNKLKSQIFIKFVKWGLGLHGSIHIIEFVINLYEGAWISAIITLFSGLLMLSATVI